MQVASLTVCSQSVLRDRDLATAADFEFFGHCPRLKSRCHAFLKKAEGEIPDEKCNKIARGCPSKQRGCESDQQDGELSKLYDPVIPGLRSPTAAHQS